MFQLDSHPSGRHFLQIPGPTNVPDRILRAMDQPTIDHRGPEFAQLTLEILEGLKPIFQTTGPGHHLSGVGHRCLGSGPGQHAFAGRPRADVRDRPFRHAVARHGRKTLARRRLRARRLAQWRRPRRRRSETRRRSRPCLQSGHGRPQRDLDGRDDPHPCHSPGHRPRGSSGALHGRHDLVAGVDRVSPRRMGRRRDGRRLAEGPHAAAGHLVQCGERQGDCREQAGKAAARLLALGRDDRAEPAGVLPVHACHQSALRPARSDRDAARGRAARGVRAAPAACRGHAPCRARMGTRSAVPQSGRIQWLADCGDAAGRP